MRRINAVVRARSAARTFERAVVDLGSERGRLCTFFAQVRGHGEESVLVLDPIAGDSLPIHSTGPVTVHCERTRAPFRLVCRAIQRASATQAHVPLAGATVAELDDTHLAYCVTGRRPLVLSVADGLREGDGHVFPIVEVGPDACVVDATLPLPPGRELASVQIANARDVLRHACAVVTHVEPWCMPDGSRRFRCTLRLSPPADRALPNAGNLLSDPARVRRVMRLAALTGAHATCHAPYWGKGELRFVECTDDALQFAIGADVGAARDPRHIALRFELFAMIYDVTLRVLERRGNMLRTAFPLHARRSLGPRLGQRASGSGSRAMTISFRSPITGRRESRPVSDLTLHHVVFDGGAQDALLWRELPLEDASLAYRGARIALGPTRIEEVDHAEDRAAARAVIDPPTRAARHDLAELVAQLDHPHVRVHDGAGFGPMLAMYERAGLFAPHMRRNLDPIRPAAEHVWHQLHRADPGLVRTLQHVPRGANAAPDGAVTAVRAWEHSFVAQHFVSVNAQSTTAAGRLQLAYVDYVKSQPEAHQLVFFVKADNKQMNAFYERFFATTGTPEAIERRTVALYCRTGSRQAVARARTTPGVEIRPLRHGDEHVVSRAAERRLGAQGAAALSFLPGELQLPEVSRGFAKVGLTRSRTCEVVTQSGAPVYALVEEITSPGFNLTWMLNATWVLPVHAERDTSRNALRHALARLVERRAQAPTGDRFLNVVDGVDTGVLAEAGFEKLADTHMYTMNRAGLSRYFYYACDRYGEVEARTQRRELTRNATRPGDTGSASAPARRAV